MQESVQSWAQTIILVASFFGTAAFTIFKVSWNVRTTIDKTKEEMRGYTDEKQALTWRRFDELKTVTDVKFVCKDLCELKHKELDKSFVRLEEKLNIIEGLLRGK